PIAKQKKKIPENPIIYKDVVAIFLDGHCVSCHNPNKQKGELLMTSLAELLKGGESGSTLVPGDTEKSEMIRRLHLPKDDEEHMPPDGKKQLDENEIQILERWIALGASDTLRLNQLERTEPLVGLIKGLMEPDPMEKWASLPKVADTTIQNLSSDYLTINRIAGNSNALVIDAYLPPEYSSKVITDLERISNNIVELDLSGLPLGADEMNLIRNCPNLEWLEIDKTPITDAEVQNLIDLKQLKLLKIFETSISDKSISVFKDLPNLKRLYLWETEVSDMALDGLRQEKPALLIDNGIDEEIKTFFVSADSIPESDKK
ncbi:MAG: hypothetical protein HKN31_02095, partial [Pricia sp.]|nr:hypothetical protein [Pricia sp.]